MPYRYEYREIWIRFSEHEMGENGETTRYRVVRLDGADTTGVANCLIPATGAAVRRAHRVFRVTAPRFMKGGVSTMADSQCWVEGGKVLCPEVSGGGTTGAYKPKTEVDCGALDPYCGGGGGGEDDGGEWGWGGGSGGGETPEPPSDDPEDCNTNEILRDSAFRDDMSKLWAASNPDAVLFGRTERAGWIVQMPNGAFRIEQWTMTSTNFACWEALAQLPTSGRVVGFIHTHPYSVRENVLNCEGMVVEYQGVASEVDKRQSLALGHLSGSVLGLPGYIMDKDGIVVFGGYTDLAAEYNRCWVS